MNEKQQIESNATPTVDKQEKIDMLCNFYANMSIEALRKMGLEVKVSHFRYAYADFEKVCRMSTHKAVGYLLPMHELRAQFELAVQMGEDEMTNYIAATGGKVTVSVVEKGSPVPITAEAVCSTSDPYNKKKGVLMCLGKIFNQLCQRYGLQKKHIVEAVETFNYMPIVPAIKPNTEHLRRCI